MPCWKKFRINLNPTFNLNFGIPNIVGKETFKNDIDQLIQDCFTYTASFTGILSSSNINKLHNWYSIFQQSIDLIYQRYLFGSPNKAFIDFAELLNRNSVLLHLRAMQQEIDEKQVFYRVRADLGASAKVTNSDLFHIPFHLRHKVSRQRFSIPGFPCLYASSSIHTALCEKAVRRKSLIHVAGFKVRKNVKILDISYQNLNYLIKNEINIIYSVLFVLPIIQLLHFNINYQEKDFKVLFKKEYILSQLFFEFIKNEFDLTSNYFCLKYSSTKCSQNGYNLVFPTFEEHPTGFCSALMARLEISEIKTELLSANLVKLKDCAELEAEIKSSEFKLFLDKQS